MIAVAIVLRELRKSMIEVLDLLVLKKKRWEGVDRVTREIFGLLMQLDDR